MNEIKTNKYPRAKKSLGQNFLTSKRIVYETLKAADLSEHDVVLEIGPGKGFLTGELLKNARIVFAVEKDTELIKLLKEKFKEDVVSKKFDYH